MQTVSNLAFVFPSKSKIKCSNIDYIYSSYPQIREYFYIASSIIGIDLKRYISDPDNNKKVPFVSELATLLISVCYHWVWKKEVGVDPSVITGLSMGLYSGLVASGSLRFEDSFQLLKFSMESGAEIPGKMSVISGLTYDEVQLICNLPEIENRVCIANHNSELQIVVSGEENAVEKVKLISMDYNALSCKDLYKGQYHSPKNKPCADKMAEFMSKMDVLSPDIPVLFLFNMAQAVSGDDVRLFLTQQLYSPVKWYEAVNYLYKNGIQTFLEFGPDGMLTKLLNSINRDFNCIFYNGTEVSSRIYKFVQV